MVEPAVVIALGSLYVALRVAWDTRFKPARVVAFLPAITVWKYGRKEEDAVPPILVPSITLTNIGAQPAVIEDLRLGFTSSGHSTVWAHPELSVPSVAVNNPGEFLTGDSSLDDDYNRMVLGRSFSGLVLVAGAHATIDFNFHVSIKDKPVVTGATVVVLEIWMRGSKRWSRLITDSFEFSENPFQPLPKPEKNTATFKIVPAQSQKQRRGK